MQNLMQSEETLNAMIPTWQMKRQAEDYLQALEQILVKRIRVSTDDSCLRMPNRGGNELSDLSREINEELERIEALVRDCNADT